MAEKKKSNFKHFDRIKKAKEEKEEPSFFRKLVVSLGNKNRKKADKGMHRKTKPSKKDK